MFIKKIKNNISNIRIDIFLKKKIKKSRNCIKKIIKKKKIYINKILCKKPSKKIKINDIIYIKKIKKKIIKYPPNKNISLNKVYEDKYILVINKNNNIVTHPGCGHINDTIMNKLIFNYPIINKQLPRCGIIHRLDKNTTGLIIIAKKKNIYKSLINDMKKRKITRIYKAIVLGKIKKNGIINQPISRNKFKRTKMEINKNGKKAITLFKIIEQYNICTLLKIKLKTGRTHQIRLHMNYLNHPIVGEKIYTNKKIINKIKKKKKYNFLLNFNRQALHASKIIFTHPKKKKIVINSNIPNDIYDLIFNLRNIN